MGDDEWPKAVLEVGAGGALRLRSGGTGISPPEIFGNFMCKMGHFGAKSHNFDTITFGHSQMVLWSCLMESFIHHINLQ